MDDRPDWKELAYADPRISQLERAGEFAVLTGVDEDTAYCDAKPFIAALVGWRRGRAPLVQKPTLLQHRYAAAVSGVVMAAEHPALSDSYAYQLVCTHFYDAVCAAAERRIA